MCVCGESLELHTLKFKWGLLQDEDAAFQTSKDCQHLLKTVNVHNLEFFSFSTNMRIINGIKWITALHVSPQSGCPERLWLAIMILQVRETSACFGVFIAPTNSRLLFFCSFQCPKRWPTAYKHKVSVSLGQTWNDVITWKGPRAQLESKEPDSSEAVVL